jgi:hypothetical protein
VTCLSDGGAQRSASSESSKWKQRLAKKLRNLFSDGSVYIGRQGDPLGPLLFALTLQGPLKMVAELNQARPLAYADDTFLQGAPEPTIRAYQALTALAAPPGLHAQLTKCTVYSEDAAAASAVANHLELQHAPEGLLAAGTPIGTPAFQSAHADACADHTCQLMEEL